MPCLLVTFDRQGSGDMVSRVTTDSDQLNNGLLMVLTNFRWSLTIFVIIITMARLDWFMMLLVLVMTPLSVLLSLASLPEKVINFIDIRPSGEDADPAD